MNVCDNCKINDLEYCKKCPLTNRWKEVVK